MNLSEILNKPQDDRAMGILNATLQMVSRGDSKETILELVAFLSSFEADSNKDPIYNYNSTDTYDHCVIGH